MEDLSEVKQANKLDLSTDEIVFLCSQYDIGDYIEIDHIFEGSTNANVKISTTRGSYVVRLFFAETERIEYINSVLAALDSVGIPALMPLPCKNGSPYMHISKNRAVQISEYIEAYRFNFSERHFQSSGRMLRKYHDALKHFPEGPTPSTSIYPANESILEGLKRLQDKPHRLPDNIMHFVNLLYIKVSENYEPISKYLPATIIHGDWNPNNQLFDAQNRVSCILDFDFIRKAERICDIAYMLWFCGIKEHKNNFPKAFIKGYGDITNLERDAIPFMIAKICLFFICNAFVISNSLNGLQEQINRNMPVLNWIFFENGFNEIKSLFY